MAPIKVTKWIGSNGEILIPLGDPTTYNTNKLISNLGTYFFPQTEEVVAIEVGNPIGLLLSLTYSATP